MEQLGNILETISIILLGIAFCGAMLLMVLVAILQIASEREQEKNAK